MVANIKVLAALLSPFAALAAAGDEYFEGDGTSYTLGQVSSGNCNFMSAIPTASTNYVALNQEQWNALGNCGRCIEVSCVDDRCTVQNKTAVVQVLDRCPECKHGALDLSPTVYKEITGLDPHRLQVRWRFVDCPNPDSVQICLKEGSNANWVAVQPTNGLVGVKSLTINGGATTMLDGAYYFVSTTANTDLSAVKVAITSVNGDVISDTYSLTAGECTSTNKQFPGGSGGASMLQTSPTTPAGSTPALKVLETEGKQDGSSQLSDDTKDTSSSYTPTASTATTKVPETVADVPAKIETPPVVVPEAPEATKTGVDFTSDLTDVPPQAGDASTKDSPADFTAPTAPTIAPETVSDVSDTAQAPLEVVPEAVEATKKSDVDIAAGLTQVPTKSKCSVRSRRRRRI